VSDNGRKQQLLDGLVVACPGFRIEGKYVTMPVEA